MSEENRMPSGSQSVVSAGSSETPEQEQSPVVTEPTVDSVMERMSKLESELANAQKLIGRQSSEVAEARKVKEEVESLKASLAPKGPTIEDEAKTIIAKMETGELDFQTGNMELLRIGSTMGEQKAMQQFQAMKQKEEVGKVQQGFLGKNPDYHEVVASGVLDQYKAADPMADDYTAFHLYKADQKIAALQAQHQSEIAAAKESAAKIASGADPAALVSGKNGLSPRPTGETKIYKTQAETTAAMSAALAAFRQGQS